MTILDEPLEPQEVQIFKFSNEGDRIYARFISRETLKTKKQEAAPVLFCNIIESRISEEDGPTGVYRIFESTHVTRLLDEAQLQFDDYFVLKFCSTDEKTRFKRFALKKAPSPEADDGDEPPPPEDSDEPPYDSNEPPDEDNPF